MYYSWVLKLILTTVGAAVASATVVQTSNGTVQGGYCPGNESVYFFSIPFADPPVGELRYQAPQPFSGSYNGTLDSTKPSPICYQFGTGTVLLQPQSEDCLYLNIYAPANATSTSGLPVKVWLYGGAFEGGGASDPLYDGCFSSSDAVVVTLNYRLGPLGYLAVENTTLSGNYGILDQLQAIRWVHDNIAAFGGSPEQILLFGQSAGAIASFALATLPEITSLVNAVVMESGGGIDLPTLSSAQKFHTEFVSALNCSVTDVDCVRSRTPAQLNTTFNQMATTPQFLYTLHDWHGAAFPWSPLVETSLFPAQPSQVGVQIPALFGSNGFEGSLFLLEHYGLTDALKLTYENYTEFLTVNFGAFASDVAQQYPLSLFNNSVFEAISIISRDYTFRCSAYRGATLAAARGLPVWTYSFNITPSCPSDEGQPPSVLPLLGATHTAEIAFVWGETSGLPLPYGNCTFTGAEKRISAYMESAWTNLARNATPGHDWPDFTPNSTQGVNFQDGSVMAGTVDYTMCAFWDKIDKAILEAATAGNYTAPFKGSTTATGVAASSRISSVPSTGSASTVGAYALPSLMGVVLVVQCLVRAL